MAAGSSSKREAFPKRQLAILLACWLVEPLAMTSITPYAFAMVKDIAPTASDSEIARTLTLVFSVYSFGQFATNLLWGRISDHIGRRPVVLFGLAATSLSMLGFGFSRSIAAMFVFRIMAGTLSGNIVIIRTVIGEIVQGRENKARAFAWNQTIYQAGSVMGPLVGGYLIRPCSRSPWLCDTSSLLSAYPYALPNLVLSAMAAFSFIAGYFFIEESLELPSGHEIGVEEENEGRALLSDQPTKRNPTLKEALNPKVVHVALSYALMSFHAICFDQIFPVFMSTPHASSHLPLGLNGGLGFETNVVAALMSVSGIIFVTLLITIFPLFDHWFGSLRCLRNSLILYPITYFILPYLAVLPSSPAWIPLAATSIILLSKALAAVFSFNENSVLLSMAAPSRNTLGLVNGVGQTAAAGARALGPAAMGIFIGIGDHIGSAALGWWFLATVAGIGMIQGLWVTDEGDE